MIFSWGNVTKVPRRWNHRVFGPETSHLPSYWQYIENLWHYFQILKEVIFGDTYYNIQNIKYSRAWIDLYWLELTFHKSKRSRLLPFLRPIQVEPLPSAQYMANVFLRLVSHGPFNHLWGVCQHFWIFFLDFVDNIYVWFLFQKFLFRFLTEERLSISKAAYESALKDSENDYMWYQG